MRKRLAIKLFNSDRLYLIPNKILNKLIKLESYKRTSMWINLFFDWKKYSDKFYLQLENMIEWYLYLLKWSVSDNTNQWLEWLISQYNITK